MEELEGLLELSDIDTVRRIYSMIECCCEGWTRASKVENVTAVAS